ncbi:MAG: hypothetical protein CMM25_05010 [Rhodospirillaceae bacterium]|nr:hypothetical protein [Rhodospirillaceae bacterium]
MKRKNRTKQKSYGSGSLEATHHGIDYSQNAQNDVFGSCMIYPTEDACVEKLDIGCVVTNKGLCSDINSFFQYNETGWESTWLENICCGSNRDPSGILDMSRLRRPSTLCNTTNIYDGDLQEAIKLVDCDVKQCSCSEYCNTRNTNCNELCDMCRNTDFIKTKDSSKNCAYGFRCMQRRIGDLCWASVPKGCGNKCGNKVQDGEFEYECRRMDDQSDHPDCIDSKNGVPCLQLGPIGRTPCGDPICGNASDEWDGVNYCDQYTVINTCQDSDFEGWRSSTDCCGEGSKLSSQTFQHNYSGPDRVSQVFINNHSDEFFRVGLTRSKTKLSGVICADKTSSGCRYVTDFHQDIIKNKNLANKTFYPYIANIYNRLNRGKIFLNNPKEHFVKMYEVGGHGINRPMTIDEMFNTHRDNTKPLKLTMSDITLMVISYEIEKSFTDKNYCMCGILHGNDIETESVKLSFDGGVSPIAGSKTINITVPKGSRHQVAKKLSATVMSRKSSTSIFSHRRYRDNSTQRETQLISTSLLKNIPAETLGTCHLPDGSKISTNPHMCDILSGRFAEVDFTHINQLYDRRNYLDKSFKYEITGNRAVQHSTPVSAIKIDPITDNPDGPIIDPGVGGPCRSCISTCCPSECMDCIFDAIREAETGDPNTPGPNGLPNDPTLLLPNGEQNPLVLGCNGVNQQDPAPGMAKKKCVAPWTPAKKKRCWSCGPYQVKYNFFRDAYDYKAAPPACKALKGLDWENELCKPCTGTPAQILSCCRRKKELSKLIIKCWWRRFTRNGGCQDGNGNCGGSDWINNEGKCFSCEDLVRSHNRGPCGHNNTESVKRWNAVKKLMCNSGSCKGCCDSVSDCANNKHTPVANSCCPETIDPKLNPEVATEVSGYWPLYNSPEQARQASPTPNKVRTPEERTVGYHIHIFDGKEYYMPNGLEMNKTQFHGNFSGSPMEILVQEYDGTEFNNKYETCISRSDTIKQTCVDKCLNSNDDNKTCIQKCWCENSKSKHRCWMNFGGIDSSIPRKDSYPGPQCNNIRTFCDLNESDPEWNIEGCVRINTNEKAKSADDTDTPNIVPVIPQTRTQRGYSPNSSSSSGGGSSYSGGSSSSSGGGSSSSGGGGSSSSSGGGSSSSGGGSYGY